MRIPYAFGRGPAGTISDGIQGRPGIWEKLMMRAAPRLQRGPDLFDPYIFAVIYVVCMLLVLFFGRLIVTGGRSIRQILDETRPDPDAPWQATAEIFQDDFPSTFRAHTPSSWEEDTETLHGEEQAEDTRTLYGEDEDPGRAGRSFEQVPESSSSRRAYGRWRPSSREDLTSFWA